MKQIKTLVIFSLIVTIFANITLLATPTATNSDSKTATVNVHIPLFIDPIEPADQVGNLYPNIIYNNGEQTMVGGFYNQYLFGIAYNNATVRPFAVYGINGDKDAWVTITYETKFANPTGLSVHGGWTIGETNYGVFLAVTPLPGSDDVGSGSKDVQLTALSPSDPSSTMGGIWVGAYVSDITATEDAEEGNNQLIFKVSAVYNY